MTSNEGQGVAGEQAFNQWLQTQKLSHVSVCQAKETFTPLFADNVKRPDFLLLFEALGMIAIDVKNYTVSRDVFTLEYEAELRRSIAFERLFKLSVWYVYCDEENFGNTWYWISALKAVEVGQMRKNSKAGNEFLAIRKKHFELIEDAGDLAKLYTHRLPQFAAIASLTR